MSDMLAPVNTPANWRSHAARFGAVAASYGALVSGSLGRLVFSLVFFLVLANTLAVADYGVMAAASAAGVVISRIAGLGFSSPLYRVATMKPQLTGTFLVGYGLMTLISLPLVALAAFAAFTLFFAGMISPTAFVAIMVAEVLLWRSTEILIIISNGLGRFGLAALLTIAGTGLRMVAALLFAWSDGDTSLERWALFYAGANGASLVLAMLLAWPQSRLRFAPKLYWRRMRDALAVAGGEIVFYAQMELDKVLMLAIAGGEVAGIYAIVMRLVDLTAIPIRAANTLLVQRLMRAPELLAAWRRRIAVEAAIGSVSIGGLAFVAVLLFWKPTLLGQSIAVAAPVLMFALLVPAFRNLTEYHAELLYARGRTGWRVIVLALVGSCKALGMALLLTPAMTGEQLMLHMTGVFACLYLVSAFASYRVLRLAPIRA